VRTRITKNTRTEILRDRRLRRQRDREAAELEATLEEWLEDEEEPKEPA